MLLRQENSVLEAIPTDVKNEWKNQGGNADKSETDGGKKKKIGCWSRATSWVDAMVGAGSSKNCHKMWANKAEGEPSQEKPGTGIDSLPFDWHIMFAHIYEVWCEVLKHICIEYAQILNGIPLCVS